MVYLGIALYCTGMILAGILHLYSFIIFSFYAPDQIQQRGGMAIYRALVVFLILIWPANLVILAISVKRINNRHKRTDFLIQ